MATTSGWTELAAVWIRGGTSKCWLFDADRLAEAELPADTILEAAFGAADARQLDGVGGASSTTSKAMIVRRSRTPGVDVDYTFAQVGIGERIVEWGSNCGNCATAVGLYAVQQGLVPPEQGQTIVHMLNTNTGARLDAVVATPDGRVPHVGSQTVPGVVGTGVPVGLRFLAPFSRKGRPTLPTGEPLQAITAAGRRGRLSIVDAGAICAVLDAESIGMRGDASIDAVARQLDLLIAFRRHASLAAGLSRTLEEAADAVPKVGIVASPADYLTTEGEPIAAADYDLAARMLSMRQPHPAIGLTSAVALTIAADVPGTTAHGAARRTDPDVLRIGTPSGIVTTEVERDEHGRITAVVLWRAARRLASARLEIPLPSPLPTHSEPALASSTTH
jgi:Uncharacterized protein conserved in bacteria